VIRQHRNRLNNHKSGLVWFTGLSASGKSTIAHYVERELFKQRIRTYVLDGDNVRHGLNSNLGFGREDRKENLRRIAELSKLFVDAGILVLAAFISPYREDREYVLILTLTCLLLTHYSLLLVIDCLSWQCPLKSVLLSFFSYILLC